MLLAWHIHNTVNCQDGKKRPYPVYVLHVCASECVYGSVTERQGELESVKIYLSKNPRGLTNLFLSYTVSQLKVKPDYEYTYYYYHNIIIIRY